MAGRPRGTGGKAEELSTEEIHRIDKWVSDLGTGWVVDRVNLL